MRDENLGTRTARLKLAAHGKPYWKALDQGLHLGYRKNRDGGKWVVRLYLGGENYKTETIATAGDKGDADGLAVLNFSQAQRVPAKGISSMPRSKRRRVARRRRNRTHRTRSRTRSRRNSPICTLIRNPVLMRAIAPRP